MIIEKTGELTRDLYLLGCAFSPCYLLDGEKPALFDAGFSFMGKQYVKEIKQVLKDRQPVYCFLTHSHFDHCGSASYIKKHFPSIQFISHPKVKDVLSRPQVMERIALLNKKALESVAKRVVDDPSSEPFEKFNIDILAKEGDVFKISENLSVHVYETPGHTHDCLSYHIPEKNALVSSDTMGIADHTGYIFSDWLVDYDLYHESMEKQKALDPDILCPGHLFAYTGDDAKTYIQNTMAQAQKLLQLIETCLEEENGDIKKTMKRVKKIEYDGKDVLLQPEPAYLLSLEARVNSVKRRMAAIKKDD